MSLQLYDPWLTFTYSVQHNRYWVSAAHLFGAQWWASGGATPLQVSHTHTHAHPDSSRLSGGTLHPTQYEKSRMSGTCWTGGHYFNHPPQSLFILGSHSRPSLSAFLSVYPCGREGWLPRLSRQTLCFGCLQEKRVQRNDLSSLALTHAHRIRKYWEHILADSDYTRP